MNKRKKFVVFELFNKSQLRESGVYSSSSSNQLFSRRERLHGRYFSSFDEIKSVLDVPTDPVEDNVISDEAVNVNSVEDQEVKQSVPSDNEERVIALENKVKALSNYITDDELASSTPKELKIFDIPFEDFSIITDTNDLIEDGSALFDSHVKLENKYLPADEQLKHFRNKSDATKVLALDDLYTNWQSSKEFYSYYVNAVYDVCAPTPISDIYLHDVSKALSNNDVTRHLPVFRMNQSGYLATAKAVYGLSHGMLDLFHFVPTNWRTIRFHVKYNSTMPFTSDVHNAYVITMEALDSRRNVVYENEVLNAVATYDTEGNPDLSSILNSESSFMKSSQIKIYDKLYSVIGKASFKYSADGVTERIASIYRDKMSTQVIDGFKVAANSAEQVNELGLNPALYELLGSLFLLEYKSDNDATIRELQQYISTSLYHYFKSQINLIVGANITEFDFKVDISRKYSSEQLRSKYIDFVDEGHIVPLTPLQIYHYLDGIDWDKWSEYAAYASFVNIRVNNILRSCLPSTFNGNKSELRNYTQSRDSLCSLRYEHTTTLPFMRERNVSISYDQFLKELYCRTMLSGSMPGYMYPISAGMWVGSLSNSVIVYPAKLNPVFCKFGLVDEGSNLRDFISKVCLTYPNYKVPSFIRSRTRLSEYLPNILHMYLPIPNENVCKLPAIRDGSIQ